MYSSGHPIVPSTKVPRRDLSTRVAHVAIVVRRRKYPFHTIVPERYQIFDRLPRSLLFGQHHAGVCAVH
eukprot:scaffold9735_cov174-Amphora_coffeaeformis.AAC.3